MATSTGSTSGVAPQPRVGGISPVPHSHGHAHTPPGSVSPASITPVTVANGHHHTATMRPLRLDDAHHHSHAHTHSTSSSGHTRTNSSGGSSHMGHGHGRRGSTSSAATSVLSSNAAANGLLGKIAALSGMSATELSTEQHDTEEQASKREQRRILAGIMDEEESTMESKQLDLIEHEDLLLHRSSTTGRNIHFSATTETALAEVIPSEDPFDAATFDPIEFLNQEFPDERSLSGGKLDAFLLLQRRRLLGLSTAISHDIHEDSSGGGRHRARKAIASAQKSITELVTRIRAIKEKASHSEAMVQEISRDISILHQGKKNLNSADEAIRSLQIISSISTMLEHAAQTKNYKDAARHLQAMQAVLTKFEAYRDVAKVRALVASVEAVKETLKTAVFKDFHASFPPLVGNTNTQMLFDACSVVDVLDPHVKRDLLKWFSKQQLEPYHAQFKEGSELSALENTHRRYDWIRLLLREFDEVYGDVFPKNWDVPAILARDFCTSTRDSLATTLAQIGLPRLDIPIFLHNLQCTIELERWLTQRFRPVNAPEMDEDEKREALIRAVKAKHRKVDPSDAKRQHESDVTPHVSSIVFDRIISEAFGPYMSGLVDNERGKISDLIAKIQREESWLPIRDDVKESKIVKLGGSEELFLYIKNSIKRCTKLAKDQAFFNLFKEYKRGISSYVELLESKLPKANPLTTAYSKAELWQQILVVTTADYCTETLTPLAEHIKRSVDEPFKDGVTLEQQKEELAVLTNKVLTNIGNNITVRLAKPLTAFGRITWSTLETMGDNSEYVGQIRALLHDDVGWATCLIPPRLQDFFSRTWAKALVTKYQDGIYKIRGVSDTGCSQLLLDAQALRQVLLDAPTTMMSEEARGRCNLKFFARYVGDEMTKTTAMLKVLSSPPSLLIPRFKQMLTSAKVDELSRIMAVKGLKKAQITDLVNSYNFTVPDRDKVAMEAVLPQTTLRRLLDLPSAIRM